MVLVWGVMDEIGFEAIQHRRQVGLYVKNIGFRFGTHRRHHIHDDTVRGDTILSGTRSYPWHGLH